MINNDKNKKKQVITILLQNLMASENLSYELKKMIYKKIIEELKDN